MLEDPHLWFRITDREGKYLFVSPQVHDFLGYSPDEFAGLSGFDMIHEDEHDIAQAVLRGLAQGPVSAVYRMRHKDGNWVWVQTLIQMRDEAIIAVGKAVPERMRGAAWQPIDPFL